MEGWPFHSGCMAVRIPIRKHRLWYGLYTEWFDCHDPKQTNIGKKRGERKNTSANVVSGESLEHKCKLEKCKWVLENDKAKKGWQKCR